MSGSPNIRNASRPCRTCCAWPYSARSAVANCSICVGMIAVRIYRSRYWLQPRFDLVDDVSPALADRLFDIGANTGQATGVRFLQRALNVLNQNARVFPDIAVDGGIGAMTMSALKSFLAMRGADGHRVLLGMVAAQQSVYYIECAEKRPENETFEYGWQLNRALGVRA
ncbi:Predicted Peptidoglycan domain-containing protein [Paraburkholderia phenazinium]|uniref:Predicted Peptidoglycan domain-containing protein n=1 Tax=Paraburkholderia phenazinium TaxID=60549 RepID=A0A1N6LF97_9BURK|nr:Predicted Peptidoglycan domain-containing protein [Paraburkholderia phenazinium]